MILKRQHLVLLALAMATISLPFFAQVVVPFPAKGIVALDKNQLQVPSGVGQRLQENGISVSISGTSVIAYCGNGWRLIAASEGLVLDCSAEGAPVFGSAPVEDGVYRVGVGDLLEVSVYDVNDMQKIVTVKSNGTISLSLVGDVKVNGLTLDEIQSAIEKDLIEYIKDPRVGIAVREYRSQWVNVLGHVGKPGKVFLRGNTRVLDAISEANGFAMTAGNEIELRRRKSSGGLNTRSIDRYELMNSGSMELNPLLRHGDMLQVKEQSMITVSGEVRKPGNIPFKRGMTVLSAIAEAGGFNEWGKKNNVVIIRDGREIRVNVKNIERGKSPDFKLQPEDKVIVPVRKFA